MKEEIEEVIEDLCIPLVYNRKARFLQKIALVVTLFIIITFLSTILLQK